MANCTSCGKPLPEGAKVCPECGAKLEETQVTVCAKCGAPLEDGQKFCPKCGNPREEAPVVTEETLKAEEPVVAVPTVQQPNKKDVLKGNYNIMAIISSVITAIALFLPYCKIKVSLAGVVQESASISLMTWATSGSSLLTMLWVLVIFGVLGAICAILKKGVPVLLLGIFSFFDALILYIAARIAIGSANIVVSVMPGIESKFVGMPGAWLSFVGPIMMFITGIVLTSKVKKLLRAAKLK